MIDGVAPGAGEHPLGAVEREAAVGQAGERVVEVFARRGRRGRRRDDGGGSLGAGAAQAERERSREHAGEQAGDEQRDRVTVVADGLGRRGAKVFSDQPPRNEAVVTRGSRGGTP